MSVLECTFVYNYACKYDLVYVCRLSTLHCVCVCMCVSVSMVDFSPLTSMSGNLINCFEAYTAPPLACLLHYTTMLTSIFTLFDTSAVTFLQLNVKYFQLYPIQIKTLMRINKGVIFEEFPFPLNLA